MNGAAIGLTAHQGVVVENCAKAADDIRQRLWERLDRELLDDEEVVDVHAKEMVEQRTKGSSITEERR